MKRTNETLRKTMMMLMMASAVSFTFTACNDSANDTKDAIEEAEEEVEDVSSSSVKASDDVLVYDETEVDNVEVDEPIVEPIATLVRTASYTSTTRTSGAYPSVDGIRTKQGKNVFTYDQDEGEWAIVDSDVETITLYGIGDEEMGLNEYGKAQLDYIADMLQTEEGMTAVIKGHTDANKTVGNGSALAKWIQAKLVVGRGAEASRISSMGVGYSEPLDGYSIFDEKQNRVTITFTK